MLGTPIDDEDHPKNGMVMDFGDLKAIVQREIITQLDHALVLNERTPRTDFSLYEKVVYVA